RVGRLDPAQGRHRRGPPERVRVGGRAEQERFGARRAAQSPQRRQTFLGVASRRRDQERGRLCRTGMLQQLDRFFAVRKRRVGEQGQHQVGGVGSQFPQRRENIRLLVAAGARQGGPQQRVGVAQIIGQRLADRLQLVHFGAE